MVVPLNATPSSNGRPFRFSRQFRLKSPLAIRQILQDGASARRRFDALRVVAGEPSSRGVSHFAFVVSRDAGSAVLRNRIKRRLREAVRLQRDAWPKSPTPVILRVNSGKTARMPFERLKSEVRQALEFADSQTGDRHA